MSAAISRPGTSGVWLSRRVCWMRSPTSTSRERTCSSSALTARSRTMSSSFSPLAACSSAVRAITRRSSSALSVRISASARLRARDCAGFFDGPFHGGGQPRQAVFEDVIVRAGLDHAHRRFVPQDPGDHDDRQSGSFSRVSWIADKTVEIRKRIIGQHHIRMELLERLHERIPGGDISDHERESGASATAAPPAPRRSACPPGAGLEDLFAFPQYLCALTTAAC